MNDKTKKVELLAPAGNLEKLKIAIMYGADAVYIGGKKFSLRARASNFEIEDIVKGCQFAKEHNAKVYVTMNIIPHNEDFDGLDEYLYELERAGVNGIIVSSLFIANRAKEITPKIERHISTQLSTTNSLAIKAYQELGFSRVVLSRETLPNDMKNIIKNSPLEIEVFIHGGMCVSYSGRCMLSNHLTLRDANRGGCAHSCRWNYDLYLGKKKINKKEFFNIGSKDLVGVSSIADLISMGVKSLKIEGRMKSLYYIASVVKVYRKIIDDYYNGKPIDENYYCNEIAKAENRLTSTGFLKGKPTINEQLYNVRSENPTKDFLGIVLDYDEDTSYATIEQRNYFSKDDLLEFFGPNVGDNKLKVEKIFDENMVELDVARHPLEIIKIKVPFKVNKYDMVRKA